MLWVKKVEIKFEEPKINISDELSHSLLHTIIEEQKKYGEFDLDDIFTSIHKLTDSLIDQFINKMPDDERKESFFNEAEELTNLINQNIAEKCNNKVDWLVLELCLNTIMLLIYEKKKEQNKWHIWGW